MCDSTKGSLCPSPMDVCGYSDQFCKKYHILLHILHTYTTYYVQNEWSHSLFLNSVQARQKLMFMIWHFSGFGRLSFSLFQEPMLSRSTWSWDLFVESLHTISPRVKSSTYFYWRGTSIAESFATAKNIIWPKLQYPAGYHPKQGEEKTICPVYTQPGYNLLKKTTCNWNVYKLTHEGMGITSVSRGVLRERAHPVGLGIFIFSIIIIIF